MHVADVRTPGYGVPPAYTIRDGGHPSGRQASARPDPAIQDDGHKSRPTSEVLYGELLPRATRTEPGAAAGLSSVMSDKSTAAATPIASSHLGQRRAIHAYETVQAHATAQALSPVYRIDLYA